MLTEPVRLASAGPSRPVSKTAPPVVLHVAPSRSAAIRVAPVADALGAPQALLDPSGSVVTWSGSEPPPVGVDFPLTPRDAARALRAALESVSPDVVLVAGDGEAALACTLVAASAGVPIARLGAGLRCGDRSVEREINRITMDGLAARLYTDDEVASEQLRREGVPDSRISFAGSTVSTLVERWRGEATHRAAWERLNISRGEYVLVSLHRRESLTSVEHLADAIAALAFRCPVVLCLDPLAPAGARAGTSVAGVEAAATVVAAQLDYLEYLSLVSGAGAVLTDSGGVQEETTVLGVPCFTLARSSERTATLTHGTNVLLGEDPAAISYVTFDAGDFESEPIPLWGPNAARRVASDLLQVSWQEDSCALG
jgi:UDP-N-acetylglucosamine 2-epimerase (non-hydrolysing)